jgi:hypothetical protein
VDPIISPQLATVATMILAATVVLTNTVSADGSISGVYAAGLQLAEKAGARSKSIAEYPVMQLETQKPPPPAPKDQQKDSSGAKRDNDGQNSGRR